MLNTVPVMHARFNAENWMRCEECFQEEPNAVLGFGVRDDSN